MRGENQTNRDVAEHRDFVKIYQDLSLAARDAKLHGLAAVEYQIEKEKLKLLKLSKLPGRLPEGVMLQLKRAANTLQQRMQNRVHVLSERRISQTKKLLGSPKYFDQNFSFKVESKAHTLKRVITQFSKRAITLASRPRTEMPLQKELALNSEERTDAHEKLAEKALKSTEENLACLAPSMPVKRSSSFVNGKVMSFVLTRQHVPSDSSKLLFKVTGAPLAGTADDDYGEIISGLHQRADGAAWYYESQMIVSSAPWSMVGYLEDDPDMLVSDCHNHFLSVINMKPYTYPTHDGEMESAFVIALNVILVCCCMPSIVRWCKGPPRGSVVKQTNMLGKECHEQLMQKISIPRQQCHDLLQNSKYGEYLKHHFDPVHFLQASDVKL
eukprot:766222-Hanusia_phi.AAC.3